MITITEKEFAALIKSNDWTHTQSYEVTDAEVVSAAIWNEKEENLSLIDRTLVVGVATKTSVLGNIKFRKLYLY